MILPSECDKPEQSERPTGLQVQMSRVTMSNTRQGQKTSVDELKSAVLVHDNARLLHVKDGTFPRGGGGGGGGARGELAAFPDCILDHLLGKDSPYVDKTIEEYLLTAQVSEPLRYGSAAADVLQDAVNEEWEVLGGHDSAGGATVAGRRSGDMTKSTTLESVSSVGLTYYNMRTDSLKKLADKDVWCVAVDQFWMEFIGAPSAHGRPQPFMESFPLTLWIFKPKLSAVPLRKVLSTDTLRNCKESPSTHEQLVHNETVDGSSSSSQVHAHSKVSLPHNNVADQRDLSNHVNHVPNTAYNAEHRLSNDSQQHDCDSQSAASAASRDVIAQQADDNRASDNMSDTNTQDNGSSLSDVHILVKIGGKVNVQLGHYQFLFIMRLVESVQNMQTELKADKRFITQKPVPHQAMTLSLVAREVELALVCPPIAELPSPETSVDDSSDLNLDDMVESASTLLADSALGKC